MGNPRLLCGRLRARTTTTTTTTTTPLAQDDIIKKDRRLLFFGGRQLSRPVDLYEAASQVLISQQQAAAAFLFGALAVALPHAQTISFDPISGDQTK